MLEGNHHTVIVGHGSRRDRCNPAESRVVARWNRWTSALSGRQRAKAKCIGRRVQNQLMNPMMTGIPDAQRSLGAKGLLQFQAPPLVLRRLRLFIRDSDT